MTTTKAAHTAGQWTVGHAGFERKPVVVARRAGRPATVAICDGGNKEQDEANARLIAAAPDLLAEHQSIAVAGNHLANVLIDKLGADFADRWPPDMDPQEALRTICATPWYDVWICWAAIMRARAAIAKAGAA